MNTLVLPDIYFNRGGMLYTRWDRDNAREMDVVREVISLMDLNASWLPRRYTEADYHEVIAARASVALRYISDVRNKYPAGTNRNRTYSRICITPAMVTSIVRWLEGAYGTSLYQRIGGELPVKVENTPLCTCGRRMELFWKTWMPSEGEYSSNYNLIWGCTVYNARCSTGLRTLWGGQSPEVIADRGVIPTYFHDWDLDGHPIPPEYIVEPLTKWSLVGSSLQVIVPPTKEDNVSKMKATTFTDVQLTWIRNNYIHLGVEGFSKKFPKFRCSRYDIQDAASRMGAARPYKRRSRM